MSKQDFEKRFRVEILDSIYKLISKDKEKFENICNNWSRDRILGLLFKAYNCELLATEGLLNVTERELNEFKGVKE